MTMTARPAPSRFPRWAKVVCVLLALVLVPAGAAMAWLVLAFSGGIDDVLSRGVDADDARVVEARERAVAGLETDLATLPVGAPVLARAAGDDCAVGQHNWKIDDDFDLDCTAGRAVVVAQSPERAVFHAALVADGWVLDRPSAPVSYVRGGTRLLVQEVVPGERLLAGYPLYSATWRTEGGATVSADELDVLLPAGSSGTALVLSTGYFRQ